MFRILIYSGANIKLHLSVSQATRLGKLSQVELDLESGKGQSIRATRQATV